ncbi:glycine betaine/L-proline ABC transporter ATP-binding protein [Sporolactobacillus kofuensis]|uniref:Quaternary amine transport ATP-binding protein n=1 Tax=Sporolactobacillus kofuensis TaxID=269672 RepID=A0ABW1WFW4_9BACL|nr:glycine betaine/L-proline ABC transporter ATP-binding protein [Sporolactobacillus kofuensis]MCO7175186.1 glycine betaine/L-proline ABC transporter ATP-binding protein [Sporolactobacillus kofuensis]
MSKIEVKQATKVFGKNPKLGLSYLKKGLTKSEIKKKTGMNVGVSNASFQVEEGEIFVIMGLSGSGKSTLVRLLNRLIEPTSGTIAIDGQDITLMNKKELRDTRRRGISMVFQRFALFPHRSILENVAYGLEIQQVDKKERLEKAAKALEIVGLKGYEESMPDQLSGGMQQRVGLARALASDTDILLMDEAFSALDPLIRKDMQDELLDLQSEMHKTIVFITHDLDEALRIGDRIALMKDGRIVQIGSAEDILMNPANEYVENFVEDVDMSKIITAGRIMSRAEAIQVDRGPRVALKIMSDDGISSIFAVDKTKKFIGVIHAEDAANAAKEEQSSRSIVKKVEPVTMDTRLTDLFELISKSTLPLPVIDDMGRLRGLIRRPAVIQALAGNLPSQRSEVK